MNDDVDIGDGNDDGVLAGSSTPAEIDSPDLLGAFGIPDINHPGTGWNVYERGQLLLNIIKSNVTPGGFDIHSLGTSGGPEEGMHSILDELSFSPDDIQFPWGNQHRPSDGDPSLVGTPDVDAQYWQPQTTAFTCAVQAQRGIIEAFTGQQVSESQLVYDATVNGWLNDRGMSPHDAGQLLELHGIPCHAKTGATVEELIAELAQGHKVIVGVDSGEASRADSPLEDFFRQSADHAIWVTGIDMTDPAHPKVIVNDSGDPSGAGKTYDLDLFKDAWQDSGFFYVATDEAPPNISMLASSGFDSDRGVFPAVADWLTEKGADLWSYLNSDTGKQDVQEATKTVAGIAGLVIAADSLFDATGDMLSAFSPDDLFRVI